MSTITIDSKIYESAALYAKLHNMSVDHLVETLLKKFQVSSLKAEATDEESEEYLEALDEDLMKQTFEAAHQDYLAGRCKSHELVMSEMKAKFAWR